MCYGVKVIFTALTVSLLAVESLAADLTACMRFTDESEEAVVSHVLPKSKNELCTVCTSAIEAVYASIPDYMSISAITDALEEVCSTPAMTRFRGRAPNCAKLAAASGSPVTSRDLRVACEIIIGSSKLQLSELIFDSIGDPRGLNGAGARAICIQTGSCR